MHNWETPPCCGAKRSIQVWDFIAEDINPMEYVNRLCHNCKTRWHGPINDVEQYTPKDWDTFLEATP